MASPPRMLVLQGGGAEALLLLPVSYDVSYPLSLALLSPSWREADTLNHAESCSGRIRKVQHQQGDTRRTPDMSDQRHPLDRPTARRPRSLHVRHAPPL